MIDCAEEGVQILIDMDADDLTIRAFMIHPIVQTHGIEEEVVRNISHLDSFPLACEYRDYANTFLCKVETDHIRDMQDLHDFLLESQGKPMSLECKQMLWADKKQNQKDFIKYHQGTHARSKELTEYFDLWIDYLRLEIWMDLNFGLESY